MPSISGRERKRHRSRSRSPHERQHSRKHHKQQRVSSPVPTKPLPFSARILDKHDFKTHKPLLASYLDIQKQLDLDDVSEPEARGRWKSFIRKWNHGELAEGWYDPDRLLSVQKDVLLASKESHIEHHTPVLETPAVEDQHSNSEEDDYGPAPALPNHISSSRAGPSIPTLSDLVIRRENEVDDRESAIALAKASRRAEAKVEKQRLEELAPRAEAGTRERQLEKKREVAASNRAFADSKGGGAAGSGIAEVKESDLMGAGDDDSLEAIKRRKKEEEQKLSERELRREEFARARREEMEQRKRTFTKKEEERTKRFIELAKQRFG